jgi:DNA-binding transcriptional ArsR family regulator
MTESTTRRKATPDQFRALAHPLRLRLIELLRAGPSTATKLGRELGESSGSTSYHLRVLERARLIEEVADAGNGRERWWRRPDMTIVLEPEPGDPASMEAAATMRSIFFARDDDALGRYLAREDELGDDWKRAAWIGSWYVPLTPEAAAELGNRFMDLLDEYRRAPRAADARRTLVTFRALPLFD